ncbi:DUF4136 domain-containing protein [Sphingomonas koreensis]|nr:DUF4136 domain-containing protein [Sphingomonas koreensis]
MKKALIFASAAAMLALSACATPFNARVSRFQELPAPAGQTFTVQSTDPHLQGGLEFSHYAQLVAARMVQQGYQQASDPGHADLVVDMRYRVDNGHERIVSDPIGPGWGGYGGPWGFYGRRHFGYGFNDPFLYGPGFGEDIHSFTVYTSELDLQIDRTADGKRVFEGTAQAHSTDDALPHLVPQLVEAMFTGFPGNSGETVKITVEPERR